MTLAPIALFTYNRPDHTRKTLEALLANPEAGDSEIFIFSDAPKRPVDEAKVAAVRAYLQTVTGFRKANLILREKNMGLANSIISGVTEIVNRFGAIIVLEDDLVTAPTFLRYMNSALEFYRTEEKVISIHAYVYPLRRPVPRTFFLKGADCWGWATWKRGWSLFNPDGIELKRRLSEKGLFKRLDFDGAYPYSKMLEDQIAGQNDSWAIRWYASALLMDKLTLYPGESLVSNIGNDGNGTHQGKTDSCEVTLSASGVEVSEIALRENETAYAAFIEYFKWTKGPRRLKKILKVFLADDQAKAKLKKTVRSLLPPIVIDLVRGNFGYGFFGDYSDWQSAVNASTGYDDPDILAKVRASIMAVKEGRAAYERDSVLFDTPEYSWPLLACLLRIAAARGGSLSVLDFGGALGSSYFQCRKMLEGLRALEWSVVEQKHFVEEGRRGIEDERLKFYFDIESCLSERKPQVVLLSSVLNYLTKPFAFLEDLMARDLEYIIIDRTPFLPGSRDRLTVQKVPPAIYEAAYPAWFFGEDKFKAAFASRYDLIAEFDALDNANIDSRYKGFLFRRK